MGKGSSTSQLDVKKSKIRHTAGDGSGVSSFGGGISGSETSANVCLFSLELKIKYASNDSLRFKQGDSVTLAKVNGDEIGIFVSNRRFASYEGKQKDRLLECMAKGYAYSGKVQSVGANTLRAIVKGGVLSHEAA